MKSSKTNNLYTVVITTILLLFTIIILVPLWHILVSSFISAENYMKDPIRLIPKSFSLNEYKRALSGAGGILRSLFISVQITSIGTVLSLALSSLGGYALSKKDLPGRKYIFLFVIFTMFFNGGLVPRYLLVKNLGLMDSIWAIILPLGISTYNLIIMKNYFVSIPTSLEEAARLDGYNDLQIFIKIIIPLSTPMLAAIGLFYGVAYWSDYFQAILYINTNKMYPFQVILRQMIVQNLVLADVGVRTSGSNVEQFKMAVIIIGIIPMLIIYPFIQKYFSKGIMLGSVKE